MNTKIHMVIHQFKPIASGAELQAERLGIRLAQKGYCMNVLTEMRTEDTPAKENFKGLNIYRADFPLGYRIDRTCAETLKYFFKNRKKIDIIHSHMAFGHAFIAAIFAKWFGKKSILKIACAGEIGDLSLLSTFKYGKHAIEILKITDAVVAISSEVKRELIAYGFPEKSIHLIPNGVDTDEFRRKSPYVLPQETPFKFIQVGRRTPQKGLDIIFDAIRQLIDNGFQHRFEVDLYGWDYPEVDYRKMAKDKGVTEYVNFYDFTDSIKDVMEKAHCLLLPSRQEGLSNILLECMSMELPVISSKVSGSNDVIENSKSGMLIPIDSSEKLAESMQDVISSEALCKRLGKAARERVYSSFSLDFVADQYHDLYKLLLGKE